MKQFSYMQVNMILELIKRSITDTIHQDGDETGIMQDSIQALTMCEALVLEKIEEEKRRALNE